VSICLLGYRRVVVVSVPHGRIGYPNLCEDNVFFHFCQNAEKTS